MIAPETLGLDTRVEIRKSAVRLLEEMPEGVGRLVSTWLAPGTWTPQDSAH